MKDAKQVSEQCRAVSHMATAIAKVHDDFAKMFAAGQIDDLIDQVGRRTASFMEQLGDMLNAMDAVEKEDEWVTPVFKEAQRLWPTGK